MGFLGWVSRNFAARCPTVALALPRQFSRDYAFMILDPFSTLRRKRQLDALVEDFVIRCRAELIDRAGEQANGACQHDQSQVMLGNEAS